MLNVFINSSKPCGNLLIPCLQSDEGCPFTTGDVYYGVLPDPVTVLHPLHDCSDPFSLVRTLAEVQPRYIILYDPDMEFVRQVEVSMVLV
jgi:DNA excision repair protein ERCC-4